MFLSVAGGRTHIGTYVGGSPSPASNENNFLPRAAWCGVLFFYPSTKILNVIKIDGRLKVITIIFFILT
ncbi:MAG: hypothetical protein COU27_02665 [Candidatus Levybacteria bacterium CG10_big_fil_rev_8_21_14_0_10_36_7]|nr:MAG: hypothetical protein COU27_02665 [Candidatus Levybacteria bacterium CG10_big_fil_rev_8_21_14_0_10_36_7]